MNLLGTVHLLNVQKATAKMTNNARATANTTIGTTARNV